jgi:hypothetical protein
MRTSTLGIVVIALLGAPVAAVAHDEAKTPVSGSIILDITRPPTQTRDRAFDESLRSDGGSARPKVEGVVQPDGSIKYGNTTIIIRHDCPPGGDFFEPPPRPGRRR